MQEDDGGKAGCLSELGAAAPEAAAQFEPAPIRRRYVVPNEVNAAVPAPVHCFIGTGVAGRGFARSQGGGSAQIAASRAKTTRSPKLAWAKVTD